MSDEHYWKIGEVIFVYTIYSREQLKDQNIHSIFFEIYHCVGTIDSENVSADDVHGQVDVW